MIRRLAPLALLLPAAPAPAAERDFAVGSFERVRVDGPFRVRITTGGSPRARASGDRRLLERLVIAVNGGTLSVRLGAGGWGESSPARAGQPPEVTLSTPRLASLAITAGAEARVSRMAGQRLDLAVTGAGALSVERVEADALNATLIGTGKITLAGRANRARLLTNGPGTMDAGALAVKDLVVRLDGAGETRAGATYTAQVTSTGLGRVTIVGNAKCTVKATAGGPVVCGPKL